MDAPIEFRSVSDLLGAVGEAVAQYKARIATLEALLAEHPAAPSPALRALVDAAREWSAWVGFVHAGSPESRLLQAIRDVVMDAPDGADGADGAGEVATDA